MGARQAMFWEREVSWHVAYESGCSTQDVSGGQPVPVEGTALPLWGLEIDPDRARDDFRAFNARDDGKVSSAQSSPIPQGLP